MLFALANASDLVGSVSNICLTLAPVALDNKFKSTTTILVWLPKGSCKLTIFLILFNSELSISELSNLDSILFFISCWASALFCGEVSLSRASRIKSSKGYFSIVTCSFKVLRTDFT